MHLQKAFKETAPVSEEGKYACSKRQQAIFLFSKFSPPHLHSNAKLSKQATAICSLSTFLTMLGSQKETRPLRAPHFTPPPWPPLQWPPTPLPAPQPPSIMTRESLISGILGPMAACDYLDSCTPQTDPHYCHQQRQQHTLHRAQNLPQLQSRWWRTCERRQTKNSLDSWHFTQRNCHHPDYD